MPFVYDWNRDTSYAKIYLKTSTKVNSIVLDYSFRTMIGEIGGYTGLLLGVSLAEIGILVDKIFRKIKLI